MEQKVTYHLDAADRFMIAQMMRAILSLQTDLMDKVWNIYIHPESYKLTIVANSDSLSELRQLFAWVSDLEVKSFEECVVTYTPDEQLRRRNLGFTVQEIQARYDFYDILRAGLPAVFPEGLLGVGIDALAEGDEYIRILVEPRLAHKVSHLLQQMGPILVSVDVSGEQEVAV